MLAKPFEVLLAAYRHAPVGECLDEECLERQICRSGRLAFETGQCIHIDRYLGQQIAHLRDLLGYVDDSFQAERSNCTHPRGGAKDLVRISAVRPGERSQSWLKHSEPLAFASLRACDGFSGDLRVLLDLEVEHAQADEVDAAVERVVDSVFRLNGTGGRKVECDQMPELRGLVPAYEFARQT